MKIKPLIPRLVSLGVILTLIIFLGITFYKVITPFLMPLFLAAITAVLCHPLYERCLKWSKGKPNTASLMSTAIILACVTIPLVVGISAAAYQMKGLDLERVAQKIVETRERLNIDEWLASVGFDELLLEETASVEEELGEPAVDVEMELAPLTEPDPVEVDVAEEQFPAEGDTEQIIAIEDEVVDEDEPDPLKLEAVKKEVDEVGAKLKSDLGNFFKKLGEITLGSSLGTFTGVSSAVGSIGAAVGSALIALLIYILALYYFFVDGPVLITSTQKLIPVHVYYQNELLKQFESVVRAIILATLVAAIAQGLATAGIMYLCGSGHFFLFFGIATMFSMIPLLGTWLVWGPYAIYLFVQGEYVPAIILTLFGSIIIGMMDNVIRTLILNDGAKLHPLLAFVSVLGGIQVLGLWGVFIGPIVASCLYALVKIFNLELQSLSAEQFGPKQVAQSTGAVLQTDATPDTVKPDVVLDEPTGDKENSK
ncbi:MAG: hypothetical protein CMJ46_13025 [Planctomyces sp.]|nr:hypothetical protein [Planctomyces sp.]